MKKVMLIEWSDSQTCMECEHGRLLANSNDCVCMINSDKNQNGTCEDFEKELEPDHRFEDINE